TAALGDRLGHYGARRVGVDKQAAALWGEAPPAPAITAGPPNPAYVIYTSSPNGTATGVDRTPPNPRHNVPSLAQDFNVGSSFRSALVISCAFDASIEQTMLPLIGGGTAVVISDAARESPSQLWHRLIREKVSFVSCVPSYLDAIIRGAPANTSLQHL